MKNYLDFCTLKNGLFQKRSVSPKLGYYFIFKLTALDFQSAFTWLLRYFQKFSTFFHSIFGIPLDFHRLFILPTFECILNALVIAWLWGQLKPSDPFWRFSNHPHLLSGDFIECQNRPQAIFPKLPEKVLWFLVNRICTHF